MKAYELLTFLIQRNDQTGIGKQGVIGKAGIGLQMIAKLFAEILHSPIGMAFVVCLGDTSCQNHYFSIVVGFFDQRHDVGPPADKRDEDTDGGGRGVEDVSELFATQSKLIEY